MDDEPGILRVLGKVFNGGPGKCRKKCVYHKDLFGYESASCGYGVKHIGHCACGHSICRSLRRWDILHLGRTKVRKFNFTWTGLFITEEKIGNTKWLQWFSSSQGFPYSKRDFIAVRISGNISGGRTKNLIPGLDYVYVHLEKDLQS